MELFRNMQPRDWMLMAIAFVARILQSAFNSVK